MSVNMKAPFFLIQQTLPLIRAEGRIINISSAEVRLGFTGSIAYGLSKGALNTMTLPLAKHLGEKRYNSEYNYAWIYEDRYQCKIAR